jgi:glc operon protein GlcG
MLTKHVLSVAETTQIIAAARAEAEKNQWAVTIAVADDGGHLLGLLRLDGCAPVGAYIAVEKARTAALGRRESKVYEDMINGGRTAFLSAPLSGSLEGGVPVIVDGQVIGTVGVSGVKADQDAQVAKAGAAAVKG